MIDLYSNSVFSRVGCLIEFEMFTSKPVHFLFSLSLSYVFVNVIFPGKFGVQIWI